MTEFYKQSPCTGSFSFILAAEWDFVSRRNITRYLSDRYGLSMRERLDFAAVIAMLLKAPGHRWEPFECVRDISENNWDDLGGFEPGPDPDPTHYHLYNEFVYFTDKVRPLIYNEYRYTPGKIDKYIQTLREKRPVSVILKRNVGEKGENYYQLLRKYGENQYILYSLPFSGIQLRIYPSGVMILSICCNHELDAGENRIVKRLFQPGESVDFELTGEEELVRAGDIAWIRDAGRRLFWPYGCRKVGFHPPEAPVYLALRTANENIVMCDYLSLEELSSEPVTRPEYFNWTQALICPECVSQKRLENRPEAFAGDLLVMSYFNDDRMYLHGTIVSGVYSQLAMDGWIHRNEIDSVNMESGEAKRYLEGLKAWYAIMAADNDWNSATCQDLDMLRTKCEEATDPRWVGCGTLYGLYYNSMTQLMGNGNELLSQNMDWMYYQMFLVAILQRSSMQRFYREASGGALKRSRREASRLAVALKEKYVQFMNSMWFTEVTEQEQGCDFFSMLQRNMGLSDDMELLDSAIEELNDLTGKRLEDLINTYILPVTILDFVLSIIDVFIKDVFIRDEPSSKIQFLIKNWLCTR